MTLTRKEIIYAMSLENIPFSTLFHELRKYQYVCKYDINYVIENGCDDEELALDIAFILRMKNKLPKNYKPKTLLQKLDEKAEAFGIKSKEKSLKKKTSEVDAALDNGRNKSYIGRLIASFGNAHRLSKKIGCTARTVYGWSKPKKGVVYVSPRYINVLADLVPNDKREDVLNTLIGMLPDEKQDLYFKVNREAIIKNKRDEYNDE
jgi:hypothetical protein